MSAHEIPEEQIQQYKEEMKRLGAQSVKCRACGTLVRVRDLVHRESIAGFSMRSKMRTNRTQLPLSAASWPGATVSVCPRCAEHWEAAQTAIMQELIATADKPPAKRGRKARCA